MNRACRSQVDKGRGQGVSVPDAEVEFVDVDRGPLEVEFNQAAVGVEAQHGRSEGFTRNQRPAIKVGGIAAFEHFLQVAIGVAIAVGEGIREIEVAVEFLFPGVDQEVAVGVGVGGDGDAAEERSGDFDARVTAAGDVGVAGNVDEAAGKQIESIRKAERQSGKVLKGKRCGAAVNIQDTAS